jgi:hypothetical protein
MPEEIRKPASGKLPAAWTADKPPHGIAETAGRTDAAPPPMDVTHTPSKATARSVKLKVNGRTGERMNFRWNLTGRCAMCCDKSWD